MTEQALLSPDSSHPRTEIVFIEDDVQDLDWLVAHAGAGKEVVVLDSTRDGVRQIAQALHGRSGIDALHIVSHGAQGAVDLGSVTLTADNLDAYQAELQSIGASLAPGADILLYGCDVGAGNGRVFVDQLAAATGADVAASDDATGAAALGGDWSLEVQTGTVESSMASGADYPHLLAITAPVTIDFSNTGTSMAVLTGNGSDYTTDVQVDLYDSMESPVKHTFMIDGAAEAVIMSAARVRLSPKGHEQYVYIKLTGGEVFTPASLGFISVNAASMKLTITGWDANNNQVGSTLTKTISYSSLLTVDFPDFVNITTLAIASGDPLYSTVNTFDIDNLTLNYVGPLDTTAPTLAISTDKASLKHGETATITFQFTEDPNNTFTASDVTVTGGTIGALSGTGTTRTATFTPTDGVASGTATISVAANSYTDAPGNGGAAASLSTITYNTTNVAPTNGTAPSVTGTFVVGGALSATSGTWSDFDGDTLNYSYQWYRASDSSGTGAAAISGQTSATYTPTTDDAHQYLKVVVTADDGQGHAPSASSAWTVLANTKPNIVSTASITGNAMVGSTVSADTGTWDDPDGDTLTYTYQWVRHFDTSGLNFVNISGANSRSYTPTSLDAHTYLQMKFNVYDGHGGSRASFAPWLKPVLDAAPVNTAVPVISGVVGVGNALASTTGGWTDADGDTLSYTYQWYRADDGSGTNATVITGATSSNYTLAGSDVNKYVGVKVTANDGYGSQVQASSSWSLVPNNLAVASIVRAGGAAATPDHSSTSVQFTVTFTDPVTGVDAADFTLAPSGTAIGAITGVSGSGSTYTVTVDSVAGDGTLRVDLNSAGTGIQDAYGVAIPSGYSAGQTYTVDHTAPATSSPDMTAATDSGTSNADNITSNQTPAFTGTAEAGSTVSVLVDGAIVGTTTAGAGIWNYSLPTALSEGSHAITTTVSDAAGNTSAQSSPLSVTVDKTAPGVASVDVPANGAYKQGDVLTFTVHTSEAVYVNSGAPTLPLSVGGVLRSAQYVSGAGTSALQFKYTVQAGETDSDGIDASNLDLIGANLTDAAGNVFNGVLNAAVSAPGVTVDTSAPAVNSVSVPAAGSYYCGQNLDFTVNFNEAVVVGTAGGTPRIAITLGVGGTVYANYLSGSGTSALVFRHTVAPGEFDASGITVGSLSLQGGVIRDAATNDASLTLNAVGSTAAVLVDGTVATVTNVSSPDMNVAYKAGSTLTITVEMSRAVMVDTSGGVPTLALSSGGTATYTGGSGSSTLTFSYLVGAGQNTADLDYTSTAALSLNGAAIKDIAASYADADGTLPVPGTAGSLGANKAIVIDTTPPAASATGVAFSSDTGVSATDLVTKTAAQTISGSLSAPVGAGEAVKVSLDNGVTWTSANASAGASTFTLSGQTLSGGNTLKVKLVDATGNEGSVFSASYVLDTVAPAITVGAVALSSDTGSSSSDFITRNASQTITATLSGGLALGDIVYGSTDGGATWTDITAKVSGTTLTWDGVTLANGANAIKFKVSDLAGNDGAVSTQSYTVDSSAPSTSIASAQFSFDSGVSPADFITNGAAQTIMGALSAGLAAGEAVWVSLDNGGTWSAATVSGNTWILGGVTLSGSSTLKVKVSDVAGNDGPVYTQAYVLDTVAPAAALGSLQLSADSGSSSTDFITRTAAQTITATLSAALAPGDIVYGSADGGATWTDVTAKVTGTTLAWNGVTLAGSNTIKFKVSDFAGNDGAVASQAYTLDTTAPTLTFGDVHISADTGVVSTDFITNTASQTITATLSGSLAPGDTVYGSTDGGTTWTDVTSKVLGTALTWDGATLTSGGIKLKVVDTAGNDGAVSAQSYLLDTTAPAKTGAGVSFSSDTGVFATDLVTRTAAQDISGTLTAVLASDEAVYVSLDDGATWTMASASTGQATWSLPGQTLAGSGVLKVKVSDTAGNDGSVYTQAYVLDATAPAVAISGLAPSSDTGVSSTDKLTNLATPTFNGTAEAGALVKLFDTDGTTLLGSATADGAGSWSITASAMAGGSHDVSATATDTAGNTGAAPARLHIDIDLTAPAAQAAPVLLAASDSGAVGDGLTNVATPTVAGHGEAFSQVSLYDTDGATLLGSVQADATGAWQITASALAEGSHNLSVKETDAAGNVSAASAPLNLVIDTTAPAAPAAPALTAASDSDTQGDGVTEYVPVFEGSALANAKVELYDGAARIGVATADASGKWTIAPANMLLGTHSLTARQYDAAGNLSGASATFTLHVVERSVQTNLVDGVRVATTQVTLPGGQAGTAVVIPIVTPARVDSAGSPGVADIPLASNAGSSILTAQVAPGFGLSAIGGASQSAANASAMLLGAIKAATPGHAADDQGHLTGTGQSFLDKLPATQPLLVETVTPVAGGSTAPAGSLGLNGSTSPGQHVALVIDASGLPAGSTIGLQNVDFAAVIGSANLVSDGKSQVLAGDAASQHFTVGAGGSGAIYAGGGNDGFTWAPAQGQNGANPPAGGASAGVQAMLHGGAGSDTVSFNGNRDSFDIEFHNGYQVVSTKAQPSVKALVVNVETLQFGDGSVAVPTSDDLTTIAGLYQGIYGRQADLYGFEFWADAHQKYGMSWGKMAMMMITQGEWNAQHEALNGESGHDVEVLYEALFSRKADTAGLDFWVGVMKQHGLSLEQVADFMVQAPEMNGHREMVTNWDFLV
ncbi:Ig-like domain-containing protein [Massilia agilis]|uniref:Ig-like domain-containing protein n=1 Tax=Massilia agilis TaxID=1811226 RepID=A0ABT2DE21_9BURK|nr:Ig-like domain-containing protein [Massilia agilis]